MTRRDVIRDARALIRGSVGDFGDAETYEKDGELFRSIYLGTVMSLTPSGKFYTPYANSNVDSCPRCKGKGTVANKGANPEVFLVLQECDHQLRTHLMEEYGAYASGNWPKDLTGFLDSLVQYSNKMAPNQDCLFCGSLGSREAMLDELWHETANEAAGEHDSWIEEGEGDPCDLFLVQRVVDEDTSEEKEVA